MPIIETQQVQEETKETEQPLLITESPIKEEDENNDSSKKKRNSVAS